MSENTREHKYKVIRRTEGFSTEAFMTTSQMNAGDIVNIAYPPTGAFQLSERPNGALVGKNLSNKAMQTIPTESIMPDERGRIEIQDCPASRGGYMFTPGSNLPINE